MRFLLGVVELIESDIVVSRDDELEFGGVGAEEGDGEKVFGMETRGGQVASVNEDVGDREWGMEGHVLIR